MYYTVEAVTTDGHKASRSLSACNSRATCHLLHTDRMQLYTVSEKVHPLTFDGKLL